MNIPFFKHAADFLDTTTKLGPPKLVADLKAHFNDLNDHVRFTDSPPISTTASKRRAPPVATGNPAAPSDEPTVPRTILSPPRLNDHLTELSPRAIRQYQFANQATNFSRDYFIQPGNDVASMFPNLDEKFDLIRNQPELVKEIVFALKEKLHETTGERNRLHRTLVKATEQAPLYFYAVEAMVSAHTEAREQLYRLFSTVTDTPDPLSITPTLAPPATPEEEEGEGQQREPPLLEVTPGAGEVVHIDRVMGKGYLGAEVEISRLHIREGHNIQMEDPNVDISKRKLPTGMYFFKSEFLALCGKKFKEDDTFYYKRPGGWRGWVGAAVCIPYLMLVICSFLAR